MKLRPKACTQNISAAKIFLIFVLASLLLNSPSYVFADASEAVVKAVVDKFEETAVPLFDPNAPEQPKMPKKDPFFDKIRKDQIKFEKKEQEKQREFVNKSREADWDYEKRQKKIMDFNAGKRERRKKFSEKQREKIVKHQHPKKSKGFLPWTR